MKTDPSRDALLKIFKCDPDGTFWRKAGCKGQSGYMVVKIGPKRYQMHRLIWIMHNGPIPDGLFIDHIDGNRTNNRIENLRVVTPAQNSANRPFRNDNTSGRTGIYWRASKKRWTAVIGVNRKRIHLGEFKTRDEAVNARAAGEQQYQHHFTPTHGFRALI